MLPSPNHTAKRSGLSEALFIGGSLVLFLTLIGCVSYSVARFIF